MNAKQTQEAKRLVRMLAFANGKVADFTHTPLTPADVKHAETITKMEGEVEALGGEEAIQKANEFGEKTEVQRTDRGDVESMLRNINKSVAAIAEETKNPSLMDRFRLPHGNGDTELAAKLRGFATAIEELDLLAGLASHALVITTAGLRQMAVDLLGGTGTQGLALAGQVGATASIPTTLGSARGSKKTLDAIYANTYGDNVGVLAAWASASHVPRDNGGGTADGTPAAGAPDAPK